MKILHVDSSPKEKQSNSRILSKFFVESVQKTNVNTEIDYLDLSVNGLPHVDGVFSQAIYRRESERDEAMKSRLKESDNLCDRMMSADGAVFGVPMHNWCYPSVFKCFIDHITRAGITFNFDENGNIYGNLRDLKVLFITTRGADLSGDSPLAKMDALTPAIKSAFGFLGVEDMTFVDAQPLQFSNPENHLLAMAKAKNDLSAAAATW